MRTQTQLFAAIEHVQVVQGAGGYAADTSFNRLRSSAKRGALAPNEVALEWPQRFQGAFVHSHPWVMRAESTAQDIILHLRASECGTRLMVGPELEAKMGRLVRNLGSKLRLEVLHMLQIFLVIL